MSFIAQNTMRSPIHRSILSSRAFSTGRIALLQPTSGRSRIEGASNPFAGEAFPEAPSSSGSDYAAYEAQMSRERDRRSTTPEWWSRLSNSNPPPKVNSKLVGRSFEIRRGSEFMQSYKAIKALMNSTGVKNEVRRGEYYEKPSEKRVRVSSERHRTRFASMVREKVQEAELYRKRQ